jgi:hypothetical protein
MPTWKTIWQTMFNDRLPVHRATTYQLEGIHPFFVPTELIDPKTLTKIPGVTYGYYGTPENPGSCFGYDEFQLYQHGLITNLNTKVFGKIGEQKSAGEKIKYRRRIAHGYRYLVVDPKGEHSVLAEGIPGDKLGDPPKARGIAGSKVIRFGKYANTYINPLDPAIEDGIESIDLEPENAAIEDKKLELTARFELCKAMAIIGISDEERKKLRVNENNFLWHCLVDTLNSRRGTVTLPALVERLYNPSDYVCKRMHRKAVILMREPFIGVADAMSRYIEGGDMAGMFHEETTKGLYEDTPLMVMDCSRVTGEQRAVMALAINFFSSGQRSNLNPWTRFHYRLYDEVWDLLAYPGLLESLRRSFKLGRSQGICNIIVAHHKANLDHSSTNRAVQDLISDSDITICYNMEDAEMDKSERELNLTEARKAIIRLANPGTALHIFGHKLPNIVGSQELIGDERALVETSHLALGHGKTDLPRATKLPEAA